MGWELGVFEVAAAAVAAVVAVAVRFQSWNVLRGSLREDFRERREISWGGSVVETVAVAVAVAVAVMVVVTWDILRKRISENAVRKRGKEG